MEEGRSRIKEKEGGEKRDDMEDKRRKMRLTEQRMIGERG